MNTTELVNELDDIIQENAYAMRFRLTKLCKRLVAEQDAGIEPHNPATHVWLVWFSEEPEFEGNMELHGVYTTYNKARAAKKQAAIDMAGGESWQVADFRPHYTITKQEINT